jgi:hypothetical protein
MTRIHILRRILHPVLVLTSLVGYLEWGQGQQTFLFSVEYDVLITMFHNPTSILHPFVILPLFGHIILIATSFQRNPPRLYTYVGMGCISVLLFMMFFVGCLSMNIKIILSTMPFLLTCGFALFILRAPTSDQTS